MRTRTVPSAPLRRFGAYAWGVLASPQATLPRLAREQALDYAIAACSLFALLYSVLSLLAYLRGDAPTWTPWLRVIPVRTYYLYQAVFLLPLSLLIWLVFALLAHGLAQAQGGRGGFRALLTVLGFTFSAPLIVLLWLPDMLQFLLGLWFGPDFLVSLVAVYGAAAFVWVALLSAYGVMLVERIGYLRALAATLFALGASYLLGLPFLR